MLRLDMFCKDRFGTRLIGKPNVVNAIFEFTIRDMNYLLLT